MTIDITKFTDSYLLSLDRDNTTIYENVVEKRNSPEFIKRTNGSIPPINQVFIDNMNAVKAEIERRNLKVDNG